VIKNCSSFFDFLFKFYLNFIFYQKSPSKTSMGKLNLSRASFFSCKFLNTTSPIQK